MDLIKEINDHFQVLILAPVPRVVGLSLGLPPSPLIFLARAFNLVKSSPLSKVSSLSFSSSVADYLSLEDLFIIAEPRWDITSDWWKAESRPMGVCLPPLAVDRLLKKPAS